jgi:hypothetical protein
VDVRCAHLLVQRTGVRGPTQGAIDLDPLPQCFFVRDRRQEDLSVRVEELFQAPNNESLRACRESTFPATSEIAGSIHETI